MNRPVVVMYSSGAGSWGAAKRAVSTYGVEAVTLLFCDVRGDNAGPHDGEDDDNYRFLHESAANVGARLVTIREGRSVWDVFTDERVIGNSRNAPCSKRLKQEPAQRWLEANYQPKMLLVVGIDWSEERRLAGVRKGYDWLDVWAPLCEPPYLDKQQILDWMRAEGIEPPRLYGQNFAHANCGGFCVRAGEGHFKNLLVQNRDRYLYHEDRERQLRASLGKDVSIMRGETLEALRHRIEDGDVDDLDIGGCGCFA